MYPQQSLECADGARAGGAVAAPAPRRCDWLASPTEPEMLDQPALPETGQPLVSLPAAGTTPSAPVPEWPEPDLCLLDDWRGHLPAFPVEALPKAWRAWAPRAAHGANASVDHVALSLLTVAASQIGHARLISPVPSWSEPCILWTALVGPPSSGKTPAMDTALHPARALER